MQIEDKENFSDTIGIMIVLSKDHLMQSIKAIKTKGEPNSKIQEKKDEVNAVNVWNPASYFSIQRLEIMRREERYLLHEDSYIRWLLKQNDPWYFPRVAKYS